MDLNMIESLENKLAQSSAEFEEFAEPHITSTNPRERKLARRLRILRRLEAVRKFHVPSGDIVPEEVQQTIVEQQIDESWDKLQKKIFIGDEYITNIRIANESREVQRRKELIAEQKRISTKLEAEGKIAEEMFYKLSEGWPKLTISNDPLYIDNGLAQQKVKCDELLKRKNDLLEMLDYELKFKDTRYCQDEICMRQDIKTMADRIDRQALLMRKSFEHELALIEESIITERLEVMAANKERLHELFELRDQKEGENLVVKMQQLGEHEDEMYRLLQKHQEIFRELKISLGNDIENLQKELQNLRALCLINSETMDYNYQILKRREEENILVKSTQQRKINKLQDVVNQIRKKISLFANDSSIEIQKLTDEVIKLNGNILEIERKADHFSHVNDKKFREIWQMNTSEAQLLLKKILDIDKTIHEQQLGLVWKPPDIPIPHIELLNFREEMLKKSQSSSVQKDEHESSGAILSNEKDEIAKAALLGRILRLLATKTENLIEDRLKTLLAPYSDNDTKIINLDNVFSALHIDTEEDMNILLEYFLPYTYCSICIGEKILSDSLSLQLSEVQYDTINNQLMSANQSRASSGQSSRRPSTADEGNLERTTSEILTNLNHSPELINEIIDMFTDERKVEDPISLLADRISASTKNSLASSSQSSASQRSGRSKAVSHAQRLSYSMFGRASGDTKHKVLYRCNKNHILTIRPCFVIRAIKDFSTAFNSRQDKQFVSIVSRLSKQRSTISRSLTRTDMSIYWKQFRKIFSEKNERIWDGLLIGLNKYHSILKDRKRLCSEVLALRKQNAELRQLMHNLLDYSDFKFLPPLDDAMLHSTAHSTARSSASKKSSQTSSKIAYKYLEPKF